MIQVGDILQGVICRIEPYGAFCDLMLPGNDNHYHRKSLRGLIHISQLANNIKVQSVEDVVSLEDVVFVKVLEVEEQQGDDRRRLRIKLSLKDASQDGSRQDLGKEREVQEDVRDQIESNLNSMIGMGVARDPMADRLILKGDSKGATFRGGYTLVGDDEGEPEPPTAVAPPKNVAVLPPVGRGRGATLPAWMTAKNQDGPTGATSSDDEGRRHKKHKRRKHEKKKKERKHRREHRSSDDDDDGSDGSYNERDRHRRRKKHRREDRKERRKSGRKRRSRGQDDGSYDS